MSESPEFNDLRTELLETTEEFFKLFEKRQSLVNKIMRFKYDHNLEGFDAKRESQVFANLSPFLKSLDNRELYIFSMLIENQARKANPSYPLWSEGDHMDDPEDKWSHFVNPIMLRHVKPDLYKELKFKGVWQKRISL